MQVDEKLISYLEDLSNITLSSAEKSSLTGDLQKLISTTARISELKTDGVPECILPFDNVNVFRDDVARPSLDRELILKNAAEKNEEMFIAPKTVE